MVMISSMRIEKGGLRGAIVEKGRTVEGIACIEVENTLVAYQNLHDIIAVALIFPCSSYYWFFW